MKKITSELIQIFKDHLINDEKASATIEKYVHDIIVFMAWLSGSELNKANVLEYKRELINKYAHASVNAAISSLNSFFDFNEWHECKIKALKIQKQIFAKESKELSKEEYERLLVAANKRKNKQLYFLIQTICSTGIRVSDDILICADSLQRIELIKKTWQYIKGNWEGIMNSYDAQYIGCSAEGHVSHILSERLSSRPLGWSYVGVDDMAKLRAFRANNGNIYEVIKGQKKDNKRNGIKKITENAVKKIAKNIDTVYTDIKPIALENGLKTELYKALHAICYAI